MVQTTELAIDRLIYFWKSQDIAIVKGDTAMVAAVEDVLRCRFPADFRLYFSTVDGMKKKFPNETDNEGFLFYPIQEIRCVKEVFRNFTGENAPNIYIFADYLQQSWWYAFEILDSNTYSIGIMPYRDSYQQICSSLNEFIGLYITGSDRLYTYQQKSS